MSVSSVHTEATLPAVSATRHKPNHPPQLYAVRLVAPPSFPESRRLHGCGCCYYDSVSNGRRVCDPVVTLCRSLNRYKTLSRPLAASPYTITAHSHTHTPRVRAMAYKVSKRMWPLCVALSGVRSNQSKYYTFAIEFRPNRLEFMDCHIVTS